MATQKPTYINASGYLSDIPSGDTVDPSYISSSSPKTARIADVKSSGVDGGTFTSGADRTRDLNTEMFDPDGIVSISSNQFTLGAGTYEIRWSAPAMNVVSHRSWLYNVTDSVEVTSGGAGTAESTASNSFIATRSEGKARVVLASSTVFEIRHRCYGTKTNTGFGSSTGFGTEVYTTVDISKVG